MRGAPTREIHHAKADHDDIVAGPDRQFGGDCADGWFAKSIRTTSIDEPGQAIAAGGTGRPPPTAADQVPSEKNLTDDPIQSIARTRRLTAWSKAFAAVAKY